MHRMTKSPRRTSNSPLFSKILRRKQVKAPNRRRRDRNVRFAHEPLEPRTLLTVVTFQQGIGGYTGTHDTDLFSFTPDVNLGSDTVISVDQQDFLVNFRQRCGQIAGNRSLSFRRACAA